MPLRSGEDTRSTCRREHSPSPAVPKDSCHLQGFAEGREIKTQTSGVDYSSHSLAQLCNCLLACASPLGVHFHDKQLSP